MATRSKRTKATFATLYLSLIIGACAHSVPMPSVTETCKPVIFYPRGHYPTCTFEVLKRYSVIASTTFDAKEALVNRMCNTKEGGFFLTEYIEITTSYTKLTGVSGRCNVPFPLTSDYVPRQE